MGATFTRIGIPAAEAHLQRSDVRVLDVRDAGSYLKGHIDGVQNISTGNLSHFIDGGAKSAAALVYGKTSEHYAKILADCGFAEVLSLEGGYEAWRGRWPKARRAVRSRAIARSTRRCSILIDARIDIDNRNDNGATCLMYAASSGKPEVIGRLLAPTPHTRRWTGSAPSTCARRLSA